MALDPLVRCQKKLEAAEGYLELQMPDHALRELAGVPEAAENGFSFEVHRLRAEAMRLKSDFDEALREFSVAADMLTNDVSVLMGMAWCYKRLDQLDAAIEVAERAYQLQPEEPVLLYNLACYFCLAGDKTQALSWLGRALRMNGDLRQLIPDESDFDGLRDDPDFVFIVEAANASASDE